MTVSKTALVTDIHRSYSVDNLSPNSKVRQTLKIFDIATKFDQMVAILHVWQQRHRERTQLSELPAHLLKDIGVSRAEADAEIRKPFWQA